MDDSFKLYFLVKVHNWRNWHIGKYVDNYEISENKLAKLSILCVHTSPIKTV